MSEFEKSEKMEKEKIGEETALVSPVGCRTGKNTYLRMLVLALFLLAAVGLLGGCATSSGDADPDPEEDTTMTDDMDDEDEKDDEDMVDDDTDEEEMMDEPSPYQLIYQEGKKASDALDEAEKYAGMLEVTDVDGDSGEAMANAQKVLDARDKIQAALDALNEALGKLDETEDADEITVIKEKIEEIEEIQETSMSFIQMVTGADEEKPMEPSEIGNDVAKLIKAAIESDDRVTTLDADDNAIIDGAESRIKMHDAEGMTWEMIVGSSNIVNTRILDASDDIMSVKAVSVDGIAMSALNDAITDCTSEGVGGCADGETHEGNYLSGIEGTFFCEGTKCEVEGTDAAAKLTGGWFFTPSDDNKYYVGSDSEYKAELYAEYGYWLTQAENGGDGDVTVNTYARMGGGEETNTANLEFGVDEGDFKDKSATYEGKAIGMSFHDIDEDNVESGEFTANVNLKVTFGESADLGISGTISGFEGSAIGDNWEVELKKSDFDGTNFTDGVTDTVGGDDGEWSATLYGEYIAVDNSADPPVEEKKFRPTGIFGTFNANFSDGKAVGAYQTEKQ